MRRHCSSHRPVVVLRSRRLIAAAFAVGIVRLVRRLNNPVLRSVSSPDDYFSLVLLIVWFAAAVLAVPNRPERGEGPLIAYFGLTAFFLVYVPFSKICHYLYYPFTRFYLGRSLGHSGGLPAGAIRTIRRGHGKERA